MPKTRVFLSPSDWLKIRASYEFDPSKPTLQQLANTYNIHESTVCQHSKRDNWTRRDSLASQVIKVAEDNSRAILERTAATVTDRLSKQIAETLEPWIAKEKTRHIRSQVKRSKIALRQLDQHIAPDKTQSPKDSSFIAKTADTWDQIMRRNLGLNDNSPVGGSLQLNILTNHSAVQIKPGTGTSTGSTGPT